MKVNAFLFQTKIGLVYLLIAIIVRSIFYLTYIIKKEDAQSWGAYMSIYLEQLI